MVDDVTQLPFVSESGYGGKQFGAPISLKAYIVGMLRTMRNIHNEEVNTTYRMILDETATVGQLDEFQVGTATFPVVAVAKYHGPTPDSIFWEVWL